MEIYVQISHKNSEQKYPDYVDATFTEEDLMEFAKKHIADNWHEEREVLDVEVLAIKP